MSPIFGTKRWNDPKAYYCQDNNPTEKLLGSLETCGPTSAVNCLAAMDILTPWSTPGGYQPQPEEVLTDFFNDPTQYALLCSDKCEVSPAKVRGNEVAQWYPLAIRRVFGAVCRYTTELTTDQALAELTAGHAIQVCLIKPNHFVAIVAYDPVKEEFVINDPWSGRWPDGSGWNKRITLEDFVTNTKPKYLVYEEAA